MADKGKAGRLAQLAADARAFRGAVETAISNGDVSFDEETVDALIKAHATIDAAADGSEDEEEDELEGAAVEVTDDGLVVSAPGLDLSDAGDFSPVVTLTITSEQAQQIANAASEGATINLFGIRIEG